MENLNKTEKLCILKSGGPIMSIEAYEEKIIEQENHILIHCVWFSENICYRGKFKSECLNIS